MIQDKTKELINKTIEVEIENAVNNYGKKYSSFHEGYAILKEEIEESQDEYEELIRRFYILWNLVKNNENESIFNQCEKMKEIAKNLIAETSQVCAVLTKIQNGVN